MGRRKLEMKRIEDKSSRQVTFSKRRSGLNKKARQLSILCDVDIAVVVFSARDKLYEFCSGRTDSVGRILSRYQKKCLQAEERTTQEGGLSNETCPGFRTCKELLQSVERVAKEPNELSVTDMTQLEEELSTALMHTRMKKTQMMLEYSSTLREMERKLSEENEEIKLQVLSAKNEKDSCIVVDGGGGCLNNLATNQTNSPRRVTLPLF